MIWMPIRKEAKDEFTIRVFVYKTKEFKESLFAVRHGLREIEDALHVLHHLIPVM